MSVRSTDQTFCLLPWQTNDVTSLIGGKAGYTYDAGDEFGKMSEGESEYDDDAEKFICYSR